MGLAFASVEQELNGILQFTDDRQRVGLIGNDTGADTRCPPTPSAPIKSFTINRGGLSLGLYFFRGGNKVSKAHPVDS